MDHARQQFDTIPDPTTAPWNAMCKGYIDNAMYKEAIHLFVQMVRMDVKPNCFIFPMVLKSCGKLYDQCVGEEMHCFVLKLGFKSNPFVGTTLIDLYSSSNSIDSAYKVFSKMIDRNVVAWTSMSNAYISCNDVVSARELFDLAPERDVVMWNSMVSGYIESGDMVAARNLFNVMPKKDVMSWNTLLSGYANNADIRGCEKLFAEMPERNIFSWNGLIGGYARNGCFDEVLDSFKRMLDESNVQPNDATLVTVLNACSKLGALDSGKWVHVYAENNGYEKNVYVANGLVDMYAKCGMIRNAVDVFKSMVVKDLISWNTIINGLAVHGHGADALSIFSDMKHAGVKPDGITFIGVISACSHMGLVENGFYHFHSMVNEYSILPQIEHYGCMVDLLARSGRVEEAMDFVGTMPVKADTVIWTTLLGACRTYKNVEFAELALKKLSELGPENPSNHVILSNIYGDAQRWEDVARSKVAMRDTGSKKLPGCSLIEMGDGGVEFYSFDERHPETEKIYGSLRGLMKLLRSSGDVPEYIEFGVA